MFSGIVEAKSKIVEIKNFDQAVRIWVTKPISFNDLKIGDSICTNGICLTVEKFDQNTIQFCLGQETLKILGESFSSWNQHELNLERSLQFGSRVHGHLVTGHVDSLCTIQVPDQLRTFFWKKGSVCLNGVSLTVNSFDQKILKVCLIPETIGATNLVSYAVGQKMNLEADYLAKAYIYSKGSSL
jgi:riboflavin synthase